ncbi:3-oxoacyl-[acyl-carrier protein] reductase [Comamonas sp. BIGb0152]|uniref:SDR family oxidoreductase n=1 Tax=Comamonas sp. BIGb0152 TaxID=2940601 RepID=UPI00216841F7|nr:SDR family oxidoreductase [Comamonas sp. BIGb0152]MCS4295450.1 3-oxoacyl-[acyl-carrier protein] reductase [Comamonas sp. BIGb0152]
MKQSTSIALITGASRGIGATIARRLAQDGHAIAINYAHQAQEAEALAQALVSEGGQAIAVRADISQADQVAALFSTVEQQLGKIDVLVNNAGVLSTSALADTSDALFAKTFAINTQGVFNTLREAATRLNAGGRIINLSTTALALNLPGYAIYNGSKAAVEAFTRVFAKELRGRQITVNAVAPGPVATELFFAGKSEAQIEHFAKMPPLERLGEPEDIAAVVAFLASKDSGWINGQVLRANGGVA